MDLRTIWEYQIQLLPLLISLLIVELPNFLRKLKKFYYIPIYFPIFPFRELNPKLSYYLGEDYFMGIGKDLKNSDLERIKKKIIIDSAISIFISAIAIPSIAGVLFSFFLTNELFVQSVYAILLYKSINIIRAILNFKDHAIASKKNIFILIIIYIGFLGVFYQLLNNAYEWSRPYVEQDNFKGLLKSLSELIFNKGIAQGLILAALAAFFGNLLTDKKIRDENIKNS
jgi:hypothetical protein